MADAKVLALTYKGRPLRRKDNIIYYGNPTDKYIIMLEILETKKENDLALATRVSVQLQLTNADPKARDCVIRKSEKNSLYSAMDLGVVWLTRALSSK